MNVTVIGKKYFKSEKNAVVKECYMINITYERDGVDGFDCASVFVPRDTFEKYKLKDVISDCYIDYNRHCLCKNL